MKRVIMFATMALALLRPAIPVGAQVVPKGPAIRLQVVFERTDKGKKVSSVPYTVLLVAQTSTEGFQTTSRVRMGVQVPMRFETAGPDNKPVPGNVVYKDVGDAIDCGASVREEGRFLVRCNFEQSSVAPVEPVAAGTQGSRATQGSAPQSIAPPLIRTFRSEAALVLADGQTARHSAGTDRLTGETVTIDVTLTVVK